MDNTTDPRPGREMVRSMGWKIHEAPLSSPLEDRWLVFLTRGDQRIMARALTMEQSWTLAAGMVEDLDCSE